MSEDARHHSNDSPRRIACRSNISEMHCKAPYDACRQSKQLSAGSALCGRTVPRLFELAHLLQELLHLGFVKRRADHHRLSAGARGEHRAQSRRPAPDDPTHRIAQHITACGGAVSVGQLRNGLGKEILDKLREVACTTYITPGLAVSSAMSS